MRHRNACKNTYTYLNMTFSGKFLLISFTFQSAKLGQTQRIQNWTNILHHKDDLPTTFQ